MDTLLGSPFALLILTVIFIALCNFTAVRSADDHPVLRFPSERNTTTTKATSVSDNVEDRCAGTAMPGSCPVLCFRTDPVCGVDGETYWCGCGDARCAGVPVAKMGFCEVTYLGGSPVSGQALLLVHMVWLIVLAFFVLFGFL